MTKAFELFKESLENISNDDFAKLLDEMENKELKIEVPQGYEIDRENSTFEKIVFKKVEELPKRWGELKRIKGVYVDSDSRLCNSGYGATYETSKNIFPTIEEAEACVALAQLCQLRDRYNDGWKPDWDSMSETKYVLEISRNIVVKNFYGNRHKILAFKTEELRDKFLENFRDLIETAKPLL